MAEGEIVVKYGFFTYNTFSVLYSTKHQLKLVLILENVVCDQTDIPPLSVVLQSNTECIIRLFTNMATEAQTVHV